MPALGAIVAVINGDQVLLTRRRDFEVWCLPGGHVDDGETLAEAARREVREETGLEVALTRLVGVYSKAGLFDGTIHLVLFAAQLVGGALRPQPDEVIDAGFFGRDTLPEPLLWSHREQILDALDGVGGSIARSNLVAGPLAGTITRATLEAARTQSGLTRTAFYLRHLAQPPTERMRIDVDGRGPISPAGPGGAAAVRS